MDHTYSDWWFYRDIGKRKPLPTGNKETPVKGDIPEYVDSLIRFLATTESQGSIARILNEKGITRPDGQAWKQFAVCRYMQENNIPAVHKWKGRRNIVGY